jgi:peroxiredoxin Q/BCP
MDADQNTVTLKQFRGSWVVIYFYPKDNTSGCTREAIDFSLMLPSFNKEKAVVIGISPDSSKSHRSFIEKHNLKVVLLSDPEHLALEAYGVWQKKSMYGREYMGVVRSTVLVDPEGIIREVWDKVKVEQHATIVFEKLCTIK